MAKLTGYNNTGTVAAGATAAAEDIQGIAGWITIYAKGADIRFRFGNGNATADSDSIFIGEKERLWLKVPYPGASLSAIRAGSTDGTLEYLEVG
tara:strand:+ start:186 stop:467 length:282 start_codon:yes stop_codon:yes gene_type:complete